MAPGPNDDTTGGDESFPDPINLDADATPRDLKPGNAYEATVNNIVDYGVFVSLSDGMDEISGLMHVKNLPPFTSLSDYSVGDEVIVELHNKKPNGDLAFNGLHAPDIAPDAPREGIGDTKAGDGLAKGMPNEITNKLDEVLGRLDALELGGTATPGLDDVESASLVDDPIDDAVATVRMLNERGFSVEDYKTQMGDGGDRVEVSLVLQRDE